MMREIGCQPTASKVKLRTATVEFYEVPGQSRLFLQYQSDPLSLKKYFPSAVASYTDVVARARDVLDSFSTDRSILCNALTTQNRRVGAGAKTFENIELLREEHTVAVLTGQQAGLFTGPLYTIYKALSAIRMAEYLREQGVPAVPVFWAATEDHDFAEISKAVILDDGSQAAVFELSSTNLGGPVGGITIDESFADELDRFSASLAAMQFNEETSVAFSQIWQPGKTVGEAFCANLQKLFESYGLIVVDPLDPALKKLASPLYAKAIHSVDEIVAALVARSKELEADGYHTQVLVTPDYFPLFYHTDDGARRSVRQWRPGVYRVAETKLEFTVGELAELARAEPERFSPGVMLRPVVQDHLFPTICYFGGGAEVAYFAQNSEVFCLLGRPVTTIFHRQSFTVVDPRSSRALAKFDLNFTDLFDGFDNLRPRIVERFVDPATSQLFAEVQSQIGVELDRLDRELSRIDPTLGANLATRRRKISYHLEALRTKFQRVQLERDETVNRQLRHLFAALLPEGGLQERTYNVSGFLARYGPAFVDMLYDSIDLDERGHRIVYL